MQTPKLIPTALLAVLLHSTAGATNNIREFWFSGAEINRYDLSQARYGEQHPGHAEFIFVTEPFLPEKQVKHEFGPGDSVDVLKLNALRTFNTGIYSYRTMTSTFQPIDLSTYPHALKTTTSVQEWCGQVFQKISRTNAGLKAELRSYFQKEADQNFELDAAWLEDELWLLVRLDPKRLPTGEFEAIPGAIYTRFAHKPIQATAAIGTLESNARHSSYTLTYPSIQRRLTIRFDTAFPHIIRTWEESGPEGTTKAVLRKRIMNSDYWQHNRTADRDKRRQLGLEPVAD